jgi:parvulin-like peptidyl-prolyl isomerase
MDEIDIQQRVRLLEKEIESTAAELEETRLGLIAALNQLKAEIEAVKAFLQRTHAAFEDSHRRLREEAVETMDPEWIPLKR